MYLLERGVRADRHRRLELGRAVRLHREEICRDQGRQPDLGRPQGRPPHRLLPHREAAQSRAAAVDRLQGVVLPGEDRARLGRLDPGGRDYRRLIIEGANKQAGERAPEGKSRKKEKARRLPSTPLTLSPTPPEATIEPISPPADALAVGIPPAAGTWANNEGGAIVAITSAIAAAPAPANTARVSAAIASATAGLRGRGRPAYQNRRRAGDVDEQQSQRCEAARQDIVAFSHSRISGSLPKHLDFGTISLRRARQAFGSDALRQYFY